MSGMAEFGPPAGWKWNPDGIWYREYGSTGQYVAHQGSKLLSRIDKIGNWKWENSYARRMRAHIGETVLTLPALAGPVLCLGARFGHEVEAWRPFCRLAVGIDVAPGDHSWVLQGDMHDLGRRWPPGGFCLVYTNVLDHSRNLALVMEGIGNALDKQGLFVADVAFTSENGTLPMHWESCWWDNVGALERALGKMLSGFRIEGRRDITFPWPGRQVVWRRG